VCQLTDFNQILWYERSSANRLGLDFGIDPDPGLNPGWIFHFFDMERHGVLHNKIGLLIKLCLWMNVHEILGEVGLRIRNSRLDFGTDPDPDSNLKDPDRFTDLDY